MRVGILGTGVVGQALGTGFQAIGHQAMLGSREAGNAKAVAWAKAAGSGAAEGSYADAARHGEIVVLATLGMAVAEAVTAAGIANFDGKLVLDVTNPLDFSRGFAGLGIKGDDSGGETVQRVLPGARVVKTLNTVTASKMFRPHWAGGIPDMYMAGNDPEAKREAGAILADFGWNPVDLGRITSARWLEAMCIAWVEAAMPTRNFSLAFKLIQFD